MAIQQSNPKVILGGTLLFLVLVNLFIIPRFREEASDIEKQHIAKIPYVAHEQICLTKTAFVYVKNDALVAYSQTKSNLILWEFKFKSDQCIMSILADDQALYLLDNELDLYKIDGPTGEILWKKKIPYENKETVSLHQNGTLFFVEQRLDDNIERYFYDKKGNSLRGVGSEWLLNDYEELLDYANDEVYWSKMDFFEEEQLFFDRSSQVVYKLGENLSYVKEQEAFFARTLTRMSFHRVNEEVKSIKSAFGIFEHDLKFKYYDDGYAVLEWETENTMKDVLYYVPFDSDGFLGKATIFNLKSKGYLNKGLYLLAYHYKDIIMVHNIKNYSFANHNQQIKLNKTQFIEDIQLGSVNFFVQTTAMFNFGDGNAQQQFYYVIPLNYTSDGIN